MRLRDAVGAVVLLACVVAAPICAADLADCGGSDRRMLGPNPAAPVASETRGFWVRADQLAWPGLAALAAGDEIRLFHSATTSLRAEPGGEVNGADGSIPLGVTDFALGERYRYLAPGIGLQLPADAVLQAKSLLRQSLLLARLDRQGRVVEATGLQTAGVLDALYADSASATELGANAASSRFALWAPTAQRVDACVYPGPVAAATRRLPLVRDDASGIWSVSDPAIRHGAYFTLLVDVMVPGSGLVRNRVTDPYSLSLSADSERSMVVDLEHPDTVPSGWARQQGPKTVGHPTDMSIYELHVRDFSLTDDSVPEAQRGKYLAFTARDSRGMRHLRRLAAAGLTDVHLLPVFDIASIPERNCQTPPIDPRRAVGASETAQATASGYRSRDCYNWGYDPLHYTAPEGSYASDAMNGVVRVREFRAMVQALHAAGLRVGMDVVYNHTPASGQDRWSMLDRIVPGYYQRLDATGKVEMSTCCANTATEQRMMGKLMSDSVLVWARDYRIDSFRFDLMGHQPRDAMVAMQNRLRTTLGREVEFIGEGWNFGEVANGRRFAQAAQGVLNGTGIGTFSDRARDAIRGGSAGDAGQNLLQRKGFIHQLGTDTPQTRQQADLVRVGLAGSLRDYRMQAADGSWRRLDEIDYNGMPAGYVSQPAEVVNYVENHDNQTLFDLNALRLPQDMTRQDRARVQALTLGLNLLSQGVAYTHAGVEILRSKSLDRNSYDSGDWFNGLDWRLEDNGFARGLPPAEDNRQSWEIMRPVLENRAIKPRREDMVFVRNVFEALSHIRAESTLLRLRTASDVAQRLQFHNTGPTQNAAVIAASVDGQGYSGARWSRLAYFVNASLQPQTLQESALAGRRWVLHPALAKADPRLRQVRVHARQGRVTIPPLSTVVLVAR